MPDARRQPRHQHHRLLARWQGQHRWLPAHGIRVHRQRPGQPFEGDAYLSGGFAGDGTDFAGNAKTPRASSCRRCIPPTSGKVSLGASYGENKLNLTMMRRPKGPAASSPCARPGLASSPTTGPSPSGSSPSTPISMDTPTRVWTPNGDDVQGQPDCPGPDAVLLVAAMEDKGRPGRGALCRCSATAVVSLEKCAEPLRTRGRRGSRNRNAVGAAGRDELAEIGLGFRCRVHDRLRRAVGLPVHAK